ncbi:MAG TPA: DUF6276 family protein [Natrialbaceae archaeon]|nr:DUF6276 family protein [Natrialbaceae archaeon]
MDCSNCRAPIVAVAVPEDLREFAPANASAVGICTNCLSLQRVDADAADLDPDLGAVSDAFPEGEAAVPMVLLVGLMDSIALYREEIQALVERVEAAGTDPMLVLDRLSDDAGVDPAFDMRRRRRQLEQLLE